MRKLLPIVLLIAAACTSTRATSPVKSPAIRVVQTSSVPYVARGVTGSVPVRYGVRVSNRAEIPITLKRVTIQSVGAGAYNLPSTSFPFDKTVAPDAHEDVEFWAGAYINDPSISGANGPVTLRVISHFDSPKGEFDEITVLQINSTQQ